MYLLIQYFVAKWQLDDVHLHPNMYLLIRSVSCAGGALKMYLHPNMYLLIQILFKNQVMKLLNLHPNMYLLILRPKIFLVDEIYKFTSQHVSINSLTEEEYAYPTHVFTSQHVSINSPLNVSNVDV